MIDPVLDTPTVVTKRDAMFVGYPDGVSGYVTDEVGEETKMEFSSPAQRDAVIALIAAAGFNTSGLRVTVTANFRYPPGFESLIYLREDGPKIFGIEGELVTADGFVVPIVMNIGWFINNDRLKSATNGIRGKTDDKGDNFGIWLETPTMPHPVWTKQTTGLVS